MQLCVGDVIVSGDTPTPKRAEWWQGVLAEITTLCCCQLLICSGDEEEHDEVDSWRMEIFPI